MTVKLKLKIYYPILLNLRNFEFGDNKQLNFLINSEKKLKDIIKPLYQKDCLTKKEYDSIYPRGSRPGTLYSSAKVHKPIIDNCPSFPPILSAIGTPTYNLAKFLVPILSLLTVNEFTVHAEVVNFDANCIMASLDIESLFTNIQLYETIENCINDLFLIMIQFTSLSKKILRNFSNLLPMSCFSHLIMNIIAN